MVVRTLMIVALLGRVAHAQAPDPPATPPATPSPAPEPAPSPAPEPAPPAADPAWTAYDEAFGRAAGGDRDGARRRLFELRTRWPSHPAAARAEPLVADLAPRPRSPYSKIARGELVFWSTVGGVFVGANICVIVDCEDDRETALVYTLSVGGALGLSVLASHGGVQPGEAQLYNSAQTWGAWNGLAINDELATSGEQATVALIAQAGGLAAGLGLWQTWRPTKGDVALTNTVFVWTTVMSIWAHLAANEEDALSLRRVVLAGDLGIVAGALLSTQVKMSRGRTLLIDVGGVLGILAGALVAVGTDTQGDGEQVLGVSMLAGNGLGLVIAALATTEWDGPDTRVAVTPTRIVDPAGHGAWGLQAGFGF